MSGAKICEEPGKLCEAVNEQFAQCLAKEPNNQIFCSNVAKYAYKTMNAIKEAAENGLGKEATDRLIDERIGNEDDGLYGVLSEFAKDFGKASADLRRERCKMLVPAANLANEQGKLLEAATVLTRNSGGRINSNTVLLIAAAISLTAVAVYALKNYVFSNPQRQFEKPKLLGNTQKKAEKPKKLAVVKSAEKAKV